MGKLLGGENYFSPQGGPGELKDNTSQDRKRIAI